MPASTLGTRSFVAAPMAAICGILASALTSGGAFAQVRSAEPRFVRVDSERLSHSTVVSILQDRTGYLWLGTTDGLNRYDGYEFKVFRHDPDDSTTLTHNDVVALMEDRQGSIWIGTEDGLNRLEPGANGFVRYWLRPSDAPEQTPVTAIRLLEDRHGDIWVLSEPRGLLRYDRSIDSFQPVFEHPSTLLTRGWKAALVERDDGQLAVLIAPDANRAAALFVFDSSTGTYDVQRPPPDRPSALYSSLRSRAVHPAAALIGDGEALLGSVLPGNLGRASVVFRDAEDTLWIGTAGDGLLHYDDASGSVSRTRFEPSSNYLRNYVRGLHRDRDGALWVGTHDGLYRADPAAKAFSRLVHDPSDSNSISASAVSALALTGPAEQASVWIGTYGTGLNRLDVGSGMIERLSRLSRLVAPTDGVIWALHGTPEGRLWIVTADGLFLYRPADDTLQAHGLPDFPDIESPELNSVVVDDNNVVWVAASGGLYGYLPNRREARPYLPATDGSGPSGAGVLEALLAEPGALWMGVDGDRLDRFDLASGRFTSRALMTRSGASLSSKGVWDLHRDLRGWLWLATGAGLLRYDPDSQAFDHYSVADGLPGAVAYSIADGVAGDLWVGTNLGLARIEIVDSMPGLRPSVRVHAYGAADGVAGNELNRGSALRLADGTLLFGGMEGITRFHPGAIDNNPNIPPLVLTRIERSNREGSFEIEPRGLAALELSYRDASFTLEFAALNFTLPERNLYRYRLEPFDSSWVESGTRRFARYTNVLPGDYNFRLQGSNNDGVWNEVGLSLPIRVSPPFWQTLWFRALALAAIVSVIWGAHRYRVAQLLGVERLRLRIASDLHDDISSDISGIALTAELLQRGDHLQDQDRVRLGQMRSTAIRMVDAVRDIVWYINPEHDTLTATVRRMRAVAETLLDDTDYEFRASCVDEVGIDMGVRRQIFLFYKEALHNVVRHANAHRVDLRFEREGDRLTLQIRDDGVGFQPEGVAQGQGHGLGSLGERAAQMGGLARIDSAPGAGTTVVLEVPI